MEEININFRIQNHEFMEIGRLAQMGQWDAAMMKIRRMQQMKGAEETEWLVLAKQLQQAVSRRELQEVKRALQQIAIQKAKDCK